MNILVIGGTRLLGLSLVKHLLVSNNNVTVLSRHPEKCPSGAECVGAEREEGLSQLAGRKFDITIDFIAYDVQAPTQVVNFLNPGVYILISSTWLTRLSPPMEADQRVSSVDESYAKLVPDITYSYLLGKVGAESTVTELRKKNGCATILRLPIFWGHKEHTGRLDFYRQRIFDGAPVISIDGGNNCAQIVWTEDIARVTASWLYRASERRIWEAIPDNGNQVRKIIEFIAMGVGKQPSLIDVSSEQLLIDLPDYLDKEPLWRETSLNITESNLFSVMKVETTPMGKWLPDLSQQEANIYMSDLRRQEIAYLETII